MTDDSDPQKECGNCGEVMSLDVEQCPNCMKHMADKHYPWLTETVDAVPIEELEALADEWMETPEYLKLYRGKSEAAEELREMIQEHRGASDE